jgi:ubiquinone/menaquinone biosynthesis C-methylase UbiE
MSILRGKRSWVLTTFGLCGLVILAGWVAIVLWHFPWAVDASTNRESEMRAFYAMMYSPTGNTVAKPNPLVKYAGMADEIYHIRDHVAQFVTDNNLEHARALEVGSGSGKLQDVVVDYTGIDISPTAARFYHKPFVVGTATAMPFKDNEFDALWSIWVLEHISNPETALREIRRVVKPGGLIYLLPAWDCVPWAADGYDARPYSDFGLYGKLVKASTVIRRRQLFIEAYKKPIHLIRYFSGSPRRLHYRRLTPNFREYWQPDSDAVVNLDRTEVAHWFMSRGDEILDRPDRFVLEPLEIRVRKPQ